MDSSSQASFENVIVVNTKKPDSVSSLSCVSLRLEQQRQAGYKVAGRLASAQQRPRCTSSNLCLFGGRARAGADHLHGAANKLSSTAG